MLQRAKAVCWGLNVWVSPACEHQGHGHFLWKAQTIARPVNYPAAQRTRTGTRTQLVIMHVCGKIELPLCWLRCCSAAGPAACCCCCCCQGIVGVRFKRLIMDDGGIMPKSRAPRPPQEADYKRIVFCTGKVSQARVFFGGQGV